MYRGRVRCISTGGVATGAGSGSDGGGEAVFGNMTSALRFRVVQGHLSTVHGYGIALAQVLLLACGCDGPFVRLTHHVVSSLACRRVAYPVTSLLLRRA